MLNFGSPSLEYLATRAPFHDGMNEETAAFAFSCGCGTLVHRNTLSAISSGTAWYRGLHGDAQQDIARLFGFELKIEGPRKLPYAYMQNGRHAYISLVCCSSCGQDHVVALDFYEKQPARYIGVLQGVVPIQPPNHLLQRTASPPAERER